MDDDILAAYIWPRLTCKHELDRAWHLEPQFPGSHSCRDIRRPYSGRKCPQCSICTSVGICAYNAFSCHCNSFFRQDRMLDSHLSHFIIMRQTLFFRELADGFGVLGGFDVLVRRKMIWYQNHLILVEHFICHLPEYRNRHRPCNIVCHNHIQLRLDQLSGFNAVKSRMGCKNLLCHCHSHNYYASLFH